MSWVAVYHKPYWRRHYDIVPLWSMLLIRLIIGLPLYPYALNSDVMLLLGHPIPHAVPSYTAIVRWYGMV